MPGCLMYILEETEKGRVSQEKEEGLRVYKRTIFTYHWVQDGNGLRGKRTLTGHPMNIISKVNWFEGGGARKEKRG